MLIKRLGLHTDKYITTHEDKGQTSIGWTFSYAFKTKSMHFKSMCIKLLKITSFCLPIKEKILHTQVSQSWCCPLYRRVLKQYHSPSIWVSRWSLKFEICIPCTTCSQHAIVYTRTQRHSPVLYVTLTPITSLPAVSEFTPNTGGLDRCQRRWALPRTLAPKSHMRWRKVWGGNCSWNKLQLAPCQRTHIFLHNRRPPQEQRARDKTSTPNRSRSTM